MKGISPLVSGTLFILITVLVATLISGWLTVLSKERTSSLEENTQERLRCSNADLFISSASFSCNANCFTGVPYHLNVSLRNSGTTPVLFDKATIVLTDGTVTTLYTSEQLLAAGGSRESGFNDILITSTPIIPGGITNLPYSPDANTVALWHFDEGDGDTLYDETGAHGATKAAGFWVPGVFASALSFSETGYVNVPESTELTNVPMTVEAWVRPRPNHDGAAIICRGWQNEEPYCLDVKNNTFRFFVRETDGTIHEVTGTENIIYDTWKHVAGVYDGSAIKLYIDKSEVASETFSGPLRVSVRNLTIGSREIDASSRMGFNGTIDEVRISDVARDFVPTGTITSIDMDIKVKHPNMRRVKVYDSAGSEVSVSSDLGGTSDYENSIFDLAIGSYRVEVEDTKSNKIEKWYPQSGPVAGCIPQERLSRITISSSNCPSTVVDSIAGEDVELVGCV